MLHERWKQLNKTWKRGSRKYWCFENAKFSNFSNQLTDDSNFRFLRFTSNWINIWEYKLCEQAKLNESIHSSNSSSPKRLFEILEETARASSNYTRQKNCFSTKCHIKILKFSKIAKKKKWSSIPFELLLCMIHIVVLKNERTAKTFFMSINPPPPPPFDSTDRNHLKPPSESLSKYAQSGWNIFTKTSLSGKPQ